MSFNQSFTATQIIGSPRIIVFTDTSTGTNTAIVERQIFLLKDDGTYLTPSGSSTDYIVWPLATNPFSLDILDRDMSFSITVLWVNDAGFRIINDTDFRLINSTDKILI